MTARLELKGNIPEHSGSPGVMNGPTWETGVAVGMVGPSTVGTDGVVAAPDQLLVDRGSTGTGQALH